MIAEQKSIVATRTRMHGGGGSSMGGAHSSAHRAGESGKPGLSRWQERVHALFVKALRESRQCEVTIRRVARMLQVSPKTVSAWLQDGRTVSLPAGRMLELFSREDILPGPARMGFIDGVCAEWGGVFVPLPEVCGQSVDAELRDVMESLGRAAGRHTRALADGRISPAERAELLKVAREVARQAAELVAAVEVEGDGGRKGLTAEAQRR